jgi:hypothetical protein
LGGKCDLHYCKFDLAKVIKTTEVHGKVRLG